MGEKQYLTIIFCLIFLSISIPLLATPGEQEESKTLTTPSPDEPQKFKPTLGSTNYLEISPQNEDSQISIKVTYPRNGILLPNKGALYSAIKEVVRETETLRSYFDEDGNQCVMSFDSFSAECFSAESLKKAPGLHEPLDPKIQVEFSESGDKTIMRIGIPHEIADGKSAYMGLTEIFRKYIDHSSLFMSIVGKLISFMGFLPPPSKLDIGASNAYAIEQKHILDSLIEKYKTNSYVESDKDAFSMLKQASEIQHYPKRNSQDSFTWKTKETVIDKSKIDHAVNALCNKNEQINELMENKNKKFVKKGAILEHLLELLFVLTKCKEVNTQECSFRRAQAGRNRDNYNSFGYFASASLDNMKIKKDSDKTTVDAFILSVLNKRKEYKEAKLHYIPVETMVKEGFVVPPQVSINHLGPIGSPKPPCHRLILRNYLWDDVTLSHSVGKWFDPSGKLYDIRLEFQVVEKSNGDFVLQVGADNTTGEDSDKLLKGFPKLLDLLSSNPSISIGELKSKFNSAVESQ